MKNTFAPRWALACPLLISALALAETRPLQPADFTGHGLAGGPAGEVLPRGAVIHVQFNGLLPVIEGLEGIVKAAVPMKLLPPDAQNLLQTPNPLLFLAGLKAFGAPLDESQIGERFGLSGREAATVSLYVGDPRRMFIVSLPMARPEALAGLLNGLLQTVEVDRVELGSGSAVRLVSSNKQIPELYLACAEGRAYLCGDRALALALHALPPDERLGRDGFVARALAGASDQHVVVVCDPRMVKPLVVQLQQFQPMGMTLFRQQRQEILTGMPPMQRQQMEQQFRAQFGVENLEQFADYLEAVLEVTSRQLLDYVTNQALSFEGFCLTARLDAKFPELGLRVYSQQIQPASSTAAIPMDEVLQALRWVGSDYTGIAVKGRTLEVDANAGIKTWLGALRAEFDRKKLNSSWFNRFATLLEETRTVSALESSVPWTLTVQAPVEAQPKLADAKSLTAYLKSLNLSGNRSVTIMPGVDAAFLERHLAGEVAAMNRNRELAVEFNRQTAKQEPWFDHANRLETFPPEGGVHRLVMESAWLTSGGFFGYDQHELVNRRSYFARNVGGDLVFHRGVAKSDWLPGLDEARASEVTPAVARLVGRLPADVNSFEIHRSLQQVPQFVDWLAAIEDRLHADLQAYMTEARQVAADAANPEEARVRLAKLPMPELLYSLNRRPDSGEWYAMLPGNLAFPRAKLLPLVQRVLGDYAASAKDLGGSLVFTRVTPGVRQVSWVQSTEALTRLISTVGNAIADQYLSSPEGQRTVQQALWTGEDGKAEAFEQIVVANPRWYFIPRPVPKTDVKTVTVPARSPQTPATAIDLTPHYNGRLNHAWQAGGMANNHLANLPSGVQEFGGVKFDVRGVVQLSGRAAAEQLSVRFPKTVSGIAINRKVARLHFLHACGWPSEPGTVIGHYVVTFANGETREVPIVYGQDVRDWWSQPNEAEGSARAVWSGDNLANPGGAPKKVYLTSWDNPLPDVDIQAVEYRTTMSDSAPFLIAVTVE
ncbi:MAG: hypothetical protein ACYDC1_07995 [Limisphaerales bacterium]